MFTGIIDCTGIIKEVSSAGTNKIILIESSLSHEFRPDQSVNHNGVCLTVEKVAGNTHQVTAVKETLEKTNLGTWRPGRSVNLERSLLLNGRLDGHLVQGHVDTTTTCLKKKEKKGSWEFLFELPEKFSALVIEKGSICIDGVSLTAFGVKKKSFRVAVIPYTYIHTTLQTLNKADTVNLEFDLIGKYILRSLSLKGKN
jgi:riboflavin synthase